MPEPPNPGAFAFPGTDEERDALLEIVAGACACDAPSGAGRCGAHRLLLDERALKHLLFYRRRLGAFWPTALRR